ncbi:magnesium/cobalt transporter CorA [Paenibacillus campinasensis]|uniref:Magnesium transport protein CorA n=1 Tax=Paenibacillus campinasensis TaxID=66347 RepID=A0ABW9T261_9BACL|nr:magnesium/cobalt transporter CorA [Paenibacillus campinasensis]MUG67388.1 magnesium/cobalt transporter CorA [Paenibacillus campinasensis]
MIRTLAVTKNHEVITGLPLDQMDRNEYEWIWADFSGPTPEEANLLDAYFHFHPLAVEDCLHTLQRPKLDYYDETQFFVLHALHPDTLEAVEVDIFLSPSCIVSFHQDHLQEMDDAWERVTAIARGGSLARFGPSFTAYTIMDKLVDQYFPALFAIEDELGELESQGEERDSIEDMMNQVFALRSRLLRLRRTVVPMRDLLYRIVNSQHLEKHAHHAYFSDIYDHLLKLTDMIEADREMTSDLRDSYISLNSNRMNNIMKTLTVITTIFMPLTLIAGIYGMNFEVMPELGWRYGYLFVLLLMLSLAGSMVLLFVRRGWFK